MSTGKNKNTQHITGNAKEAQNIPSESRKANPTTDVHTKKKLETPQFVERDRSANERAKKNKQ